MSRRKRTLSELVFQSSSSNLSERFLQKDDYSCGYYSLKSVVQALTGTDYVTRDNCGLTKEGLSQNKMVKCLRRNGISVSLNYSLRISDIEKITTKGGYIIVYDHLEEHWLVLYKIDEESLFFYDPEGIIMRSSYSYMYEDLNWYGVVCKKVN